MIAFRFVLPPSGAIIRAELGDVECGDTAHLNETCLSGPAGEGGGAWEQFILQSYSVLSELAACAKLTKPASCWMLMHKMMRASVAPERRGGGSPLRTNCGRCILIIPFASTARFQQTHNSIFLSPNTQIPASGFISVIWLWCVCVCVASQITCCIESTCCPQPSSSGAFFVLFRMFSWQRRTGAVCVVVCACVCVWGGWRGGKGEYQESALMRKGSRCEWQYDGMLYVTAMLQPPHGRACEQACEQACAVHVLGFSKEKHSQMRLSRWSRTVYTRPEPYSPGSSSIKDKIWKQL